MKQPPDFGELFDEPPADDERERLARAHDFLIEAGPPPELPPWLEQPPTPWSEGEHFKFFERPRTAQLAERRRRRSRRYTLVALAAAIATVAFVAGYLTNGSNEPARFATQFTVEMNGTSAAPPHASAAILVAERDSAGNWPMLLRVGGLRQLPRGDYYELFLTSHGKPAASCGTFRVTKRVTDVRLNAPYDFRKYTGWVVTRHYERAPQKHPVLLRTTKV